MQASAACCCIASKPVSQFAYSISNSKLSPNSSKTRYCSIDSRRCRVVACSSDVESEKQIEATVKNPWQQKGGHVFALLLAALQAVAPIPWDGAAEAVLYSPDTKVPRSAEVALRRAIPAVNTSMKKMQESLEDIFYLLRIPQRKPYGTSVPLRGLQIRVSKHGCKLPGLTDSSVK